MKIGVKRDYNGPGLHRECKNLLILGLLHA